MFSKKLLERLKIVQKLQHELVNNFGYEVYNVFVFGSFLTERYKEGVSDIDLAVYTESVSKYIDIADYILDFFKQYSIKVDILYVDINTIAPIYYAPLDSPAKFTNYYPAKLQEFYSKCKEAYEKARELL